MKILISSDGKHAHYFQRMAWANAFSSIGFNVMLWDCKTVPAFDIFDTFEPDIFLGQSYNLDEAFALRKKKNYLKNSKTKQENQTSYIFIIMMPTLKEPIITLRPSESSRYR